MILMEYLIIFRFYLLANISKVISQFHVPCYMEFCERKKKKKKKKKNNNNNNKK